MRWIAGDMVVASFDEDAVAWTIRRVTDERRGNRLSDGGKQKNGSCTVRFAMSKEDIARVGLQVGEPGYDCTLLSADSDSAVFKMA